MQKKNLYIIINQVFNKKHTMLCNICFENNDLLYSIADCQHQFCLNCCMNHISTKADLFVDILCPDNQCKKSFNRISNIMNRLPIKTINNIKKRQRFVFLLNNSNFKQCSIVQCDGLIDMKLSKKICDKCKTPHCPKCIKPFHQVPCLLTNQDRQMRQLYYQKCPKCSIWIQKKQGCMYVDCKCGTSFCYACGVKFQQDPCRLRQVWAVELQLRNIFNKLKIKIPQNKSECIGYFIKLPFKILLLILVTILLSLITYAIILLGLGLLIVFLPFIIIALSCSSQKPYIVILVILFLPLLCALAIFLLCILILGYPLLRKTNHHGIYDGLDVVVNNSIKKYMSVVMAIL